MEPAAATRRLLAPPLHRTLRIRALSFPLPGRAARRFGNPWRRQGPSSLASCTLGVDGGGDGLSSASLRPLVRAGTEAALSSSFNQGLVFDVGAPDAWDAREVGSPVVKRYIGDESERWFLWYHGRGEGDGDCIGLATSANGIHWKRGGLAVNRSDDWWAFDTGGVRPGDVITMSSAKVSSPGAFYWMYYTGYVAKKVETTTAATGGADALRSLPGLAISRDGRNWARIEGEHHTGALLGNGEEGEWDSLFLASPRVVFHGAGDLRMYYHSFDPHSRQWAIGVARSRDGINWTRMGKVLGSGPAGAFDEAGVMCGDVVKIPGKREGERGRGGHYYLMAYQGVAADGRRSIGMAESPDGLRDWRRRSGGAVLGPSAEGGWDDGGVGSPSLVWMDGEQVWRLYYAGVGQGGRRSGIGMAQSDGPDLRSFKRCSGGSRFSLSE